MTATFEPMIPRVGGATHGTLAGAPTDAIGKGGSRPNVEIVVPVYNEEHVIVASVGRLHDYLEEHFPLSWSITIADNASTDATLALARALERTLSGVRVVRFEEKGRGHALRAAWERSRADVVAYVDADLSTDLGALHPLIAPLVSGHSGISIGTRLARDSRVRRGWKRELISRTYNRILHTVLHCHFTDAQCGFKALRRDVSAVLVPMIEDQSWFFDAELLVLAERNGIRIHEVPVDWIEDPDSSVDIIRTALGDLRGVARLVRTFALGGGSVDPRRLAMIDDCLAIARPGSDRACPSGSPVA